MGGRVILYGLVALMIFLTIENGVSGAPAPAPDICLYHRNRKPKPTGAAPVDEKKISKIKRFEKLLVEFIEAEKALESGNDQKKPEESKTFTFASEFWSDYYKLMDYYKRLFGLW